MQLYQDFAPTPMDRAGMPVRGEEDPNKYDKWFVLPTMRTRDSGIAEESNWAAAIAALEKRGDKQADEDGYDDFTTLSFGHWACGWFEIIVAKPLTPAAKIAKDIDAVLADYPLLDDEDYYERETNEHHDFVHEHCDSLVRNYWGNDLEAKLAKHFKVKAEWITDADLVEGWDPLAVASKLEWHYEERTPDDDEVFDALLDLDCVQITLEGGEVVGAS